MRSTSLALSCAAGVMLSGSLLAQALVPPADSVASFVPTGSFGKSVALSGPDLIVGAPGEPDDGAFYVYRRSGADWIQVQRESSPDGLPRFGLYVAADGDVLAVAGIATPIYVYRRVPGAGWMLEDSPFPVGTGGVQNLAVDGDTLVVTASAVGSEQQLLTYERNGSSWDEVDRLVLSSSPFAGILGLHLDGDRLVEMPLDFFTPGTEVNTYSRSGSGWVFSKQIVRPDGLSWTSPSGRLQGTTFVVGDNSLSDGGLFVYEDLPGLGWTLADDLTPANGFVGGALGLEGDRMAASSPAGIGLYERVAGTWSQYSTLDEAIPPGGPAGSKSWAMSMDEFVMGLEGSAQVNVYHTRVSSSYCTAKVSSMGCVGALALSPGSSPVSQADSHSVEVAGIDGRILGVAFVSQSGRAAIPFAGGTLCLAGPLKRGTPSFSFGTTGQCDGTLSLSANSGSSVFDPGSGATSWAQVWYRDASDAFGIGLTDAIEIAYY